MASSQKVKSGTEQQVELLFVLKEKVDLVYQQLNQYRGACRSVDRLNRAVRRTGGQLDPDRMLAEFVKFERDYRVSKKRLRKLDRQLLAINLYDKLYDLYESLVMGESIGTGGDLIDSSAIDKAVVGCSGPVGTDDTSVDDFAGISIDPDTHIEVEMNLMEDACLEPRQSETLNHSPNKSSPDLSLSSSFQVVSPNSQQFQLYQSYSTSSNLNQRIHLSVPRFKCSWEGCDYGTNNNNYLKKHMIVHSDERSFHCSLCDKSFKISSFSKHKLFHEREPRFKCNWEGCDYDTSSIINLKTHQNVHTRERPFQCPQCDKSFKYSSCLLNHKRTHESEKRFKCNWEGCDFRTNRNEKLKAHQTVHTGERPFQCPQCDKSFKTSSYLSTHKRTHESEPRFKCDWEGCGYATHDKSMFKAHQTVHSDERPFQCPQCDKSFKYSSGLLNHKRTHESEKRFKCNLEGCDFRTNRNEKLKVHQTVHTGERPFQCPQCDKSFKRSSVLSIHKRTHESEPRFKCKWEGCDYGTHRNQHFKFHQAVHTGNHRFKCSWEGCDFGTNYSQSLKAHQTIHSDERPFQCPQCDKSFKTSSLLSSHKRTHESEPRFKCSWEGCDYGSHHLVSLTKHQNRHMAN